MNQEFPENTFAPAILEKHGFENKLMSRMKRPLKVAMWPRWMESQLQITVTTRVAKPCVGKLIQLKLMVCTLHRWWYERWRESTPTTILPLHQTLKKYSAWDHNCHRCKILSQCIALQGRQICHLVGGSFKPSLKEPSSWILSAVAGLIFWQS